MESDTACETETITTSGLDMFTGPAENERGHREQPQTLLQSFRTTLNQFSRKPQNQNHFFNFSHPHNHFTGKPQTFLESLTTIRKQFTKKPETLLQSF
jgi:hypothetical protein